MTLDPDKLDRLDQDLRLIGDARGRRGSAAERITGEALSWPGVYRAKGHIGSVALRVGQRELGHIHGDAVADVPLPPELRDQIVKDGVMLEHQSRHDSGWIRLPLETEEGVQQTLALLRDNYERA